MPASRQAASRSSFSGRDVELARVVQVVLDAEGAAVELRSANLDELEQFGLDAGFFERVGHGGHAGGELQARFPESPSSRDAASVVS